MIWCFDDNDDDDGNNDDEGNYEDDIDTGGNNKNFGIDWILRFQWADACNVDDDEGNLNMVLIKMTKAMMTKIMTTMRH